MKKKGLVLGMLAMVLVFGLVFVACSKKGGGSGGGGGADATVSVATVKGSGKNWTLSKDSDFKYDLIKIDGADYVQITHHNLPADFKKRENKEVLIDTLTVKIPEKIEGYTVGSIGKDAFYTPYVTAVTIPDTVVEIGEYAFRDSSIGLINQFHKTSQKPQKTGPRCFYGLRKSWRFHCHTCRNNGNSAERFL
jgi:hypothetical protein